MSALTDNIRLHIRLDALHKDDGEKLIRYLQSGDEAQAASIPTQSLDAAYLCDGETGSPLAWNEECARLLRLLVRRKMIDSLGVWFAVAASEPDLTWANLPLCQSRLREAGISDAAFTDMLANTALAWDDTPTPAGLLLLKASDDQLLKYCRSKAGDTSETVPELLALAQPERLLGFLRGGLTLDPSIYETLLDANFALFQDTVRNFAEGLRDFFDKISLLQTLVEGDPARHGKWAEAQIERRLAKKPGPDNSECFYISKTLWQAGSAQARPFTQDWLRGAYEQGRDSYHRMHLSLLDFLAEKFPAELPAAASACLDHPLGEIALAGLKALLKPAVPPGAPAFLSEARRMLAHADAEAVAKAAPLLAGWDLAGVTADLWSLMRHKSRPVRLAAARALLPLGRAALEGPCRELLAHKKADLRQTAVILLAMAGGGESTARLKQHLETEENDDVRDEILRALDRLGGGTAFTAAELAARVAKTVERFKKPPTSWPKTAGLRLPRRSGPALDDGETLYLFIRQSRAKDMRADLEAKALYAQLDRPGCGDAARTVLSRFLDSNQDAGDRWMMTFAALLGDDRLVPPLQRAILDWADNSRGKLAEYGTQALALLGTDAALMTVDALSVRFRSKNKNVGAAAAEAFTAAAEARGVSVEELGDLVVPWLGFEPGRPLRVELGKGAVEARIGPDFKPVYTDPATGKRTGKLPTSAPAEAQARAKELAASLKDAAKSQLLRLETLLVRQFAWPVERWSALYPHHPLLRPFAQRLVWAAVAGGGAPRFFHMLKDGSLTDAEDQPVDLPAEGAVHIAHPLEMGESTRQAWIAHLADHAIEPPFPQLARPVARVEEKDRARRRGDTLVGTELNAMTFRGRAEKLGWVRGSVADAGCVTSYRKHFAGAGIDAFLLLEGMYMGIDREASITLDQYFFVKAGAVSTGSYVYDEPNSDDDPRLLAFGDVPEIPYSEVMGDLARIAGNRDAAEAES